MITAALRLLCSSDGRLELNDLYSQLSVLASHDKIENVLKDSDVFVTSGDQNKVVVAKTRLRLCRTKGCQGCRNLHLCRRYLFGHCPYDKGRWGCRFGHDLCSEHNTRVLSQHSLLELDRSELCVILLQNDTSLLPPVCMAYNQGRGQYGNCPDQEACRRLHVCKTFIRGSCDGSTECGRCHDFYEPHPMKTLQNHGVPSQLMGSMLPAYSNMFMIWYSDHRGNITPAPTSAAEKSELCLFHIRNDCRHGSRCQRVHFHLPYKWEVKEGDVWRPVPDSEELERAFCNPAKAYSDGSVPVYFDTMTQGYMEVRRLSTLSSVLNPTSILTTTWVWYWEDENGSWIQYGSSQGTHNTPSINSEDLEKKYQKDSSATIKLTADQHCYELNMQDMMQYDRQMGTKRPVRRRPLFVSAEDVQKIKASQKDSRGLSHDFKALPSHWDKINMPESDFKRIFLKSHSDEYQKIAELFNQTMAGFNVKSIERVQNQDLWNVFQWQRDVMRKKTAGKENEKLLFHGTESKHIDAICQQNFDWRICGVHGTAYGKGSYFASDAKYSHSYTESGTRCMFVCRVLVGEYTNGNSSYVRPPLKDGENYVFYDSCVNDISNPTIFVVFEKHQVYPEYLIQYEEAGKTSPEHILMDEFSQMSLANLDDLSVHDQLSTHSSFSSISSEDDVEVVHPVSSSITVTGPPVVPKLHAIRHRMAFRPILKTKSFKSSMVRNLKSKTVGPQRHQVHPSRFGSAVPPRILSVNSKTSVLIRSQNGSQEGSNLTESTEGSSPPSLSANLSTDDKTSNSVRNRRARHHRSIRRFSSMSSSANLCTDNRTSNSVKNHSDRPRSDLTRSTRGLGSVSLFTSLSTDAKTSNTRSQKARQWRSNLKTSSGQKSSMTSSANLSADSKTSNSVKNQNVRQQRSNSTRPAGGFNSATSASANQSSDTKTSKPVRSQNAKQELSNVTRSAGALNPVSSSTNRSSDTKTSKSVRSQNTKQEVTHVKRPVGEVRPVVSAKFSADKNSVKTHNARQQTSCSTGSVSSSAHLSAQSNTQSKSVRAASVKTPRASTPSTTPKTSVASQRNKTPVKGCTKRR